MSPGEPDGEHCSTTRCAHHVDLAAARLDDSLRESTNRGRVRRISRTATARSNRWKSLFCWLWSMPIPWSMTRTTASAPSTDSSISTGLALPVLQRVAQKVGDDLLDAHPIPRANHLHHAAKLNRTSSPGAHVGKPLDDLAHDVGEVEHRPRQSFPAEILDTSRRWWMSRSSRIALFSALARRSPSAFTEVFLAAARALYTPPVTPWESIAPLKALNLHQKSGERRPQFMPRDGQEVISHADGRLDRIHLHITLLVALFRNRRCTAFPRTSERDPWKCAPATSIAGKGCSPLAYDAPMGGSIWVPPVYFPSLAGCASNGARTTRPTPVTLGAALLSASPSSAPSIHSELADAAPFGGDEAMAQPWRPRELYPLASHHKGHLSRHRRRRGSSTTRLRRARSTCSSIDRRLRHGAIFPHAPWPA